jgi:ubiquitin-activating enzyme E1
MVRLAQEIADLSSSLPIDSYNAITVRADVNRLDVIKAMIAGAENTPYAHGLFEYHVYLPSEYPAGPPKCNLETTGNGDVRFNPNLYSCGKVCLSLLGTWRGSASENWDPKISNLLQLFLSIQSVVMSEEVYFNEPGYEGEAGTEEGEKKNEGYSNIVRLNNIKHAMIKPDQDAPRRLRGGRPPPLLHQAPGHPQGGAASGSSSPRRGPAPTPGWSRTTTTSTASKFMGNSKTYVADLKAAINDLENVLKDLVQNSDPHHIFAAKKLFHGKGKAKSKAKKAAAGELKAVQEKVDTTWDDIKKSETFDANDKKVADRWSRYIGAMGIEAVKKQSTAKVAIVGLNNLGLEVAKNIVLSGVHTLTLVDWRTVEEADLLGNFYASQAEVGQNRAACVKSKIQQLNFYVKVEEIDLKAKPSAEFVADQTVLIIADNFLPQTQGLLEAARDNKVKVVIAETVGVFARIFVDFGPAFVVNDRDGEDPSECYIKSVDQKTNTITLFDKSFNQLRDGDFIAISEAETGPGEGEGLQELNESIHKIRNMKKVTEIEVEDLSKFKPYQRNGKIKELKVPLTHKFRDYLLMTPANFAEFLDENLSIHDFMKIDAVPQVAQCFLLKEQLEKTAKKELSRLGLKELTDLASEEQKKDEKLMKKLALFWATAKGSIHSLDAFIGGIVSQEAIIGITGKFTPVKQLFCTDVEEVLAESVKEAPEKLTEEKVGEILKAEGKYGRLALLIGSDLLKLIKDSRLFMVGAGAIGCELLKNCAMIGFGCGPAGSVTLTDPDSIELSNLNRQFLFREKHISKPKSLVAASVVQTMNEDYNGKIVARLEKVCDETEEVFSDEFIQRQSICLNALDNVKARVYMDQRCVKNHVPLLESGTLGPKGHVQVIVPGVTENYAQVRDANEEHNIPVCTLKMFPEEPVHCMEWAKDRFEVLFAQNPKSVERVLEEFKAKGDVAGVYAKIKKAVLKLLKNRPKSPQDALEAARKFFQKNFSNKISQLLHVYPLDHKTKDGKLFWTLPKRPPTARQFDLNDPLDAKFLDSYARLLCRIWGLNDALPHGEELRKVVEAVKIEPFKPKDSDVEKIKKDVEKMEKKDAGEPKEEKAEEPQEAPVSDEAALNDELNALLKSLDVDALLKQVRPEVFEKDNDANNHVDLIYSLGALRSRNYKLPEMDWMTTKLKAGRIVPALATTTATIAALQTLEAVKLVKKSKIDDFKNCFLNLAIPSMTLSEPGPVAKFRVHDGLTVTVWDRWNFEFTADANNRFKDFADFVEGTYRLHLVDILKDNKPIFLSAINDRKVFEKVPLADLLELEKGENCFVSVICKLTPESEKPVANLPLVRVAFK